MQQNILNNRYELERKIGEGGMARVYLGRDQRLNRRVAIKVLHSHYASDPAFLNRFHHEAQAAANLRHPTIVDVYDVGQDGEVQYIVMEYVEGSDLKTQLLHGPLPVEQAVMVAGQVAEGLEAAHRAGLIHRDIKPQNIIVGPSGRVKITDFGIAKSKLSTAMTETGVTFGTADYISPEQARGQTASASSDIYSLGVTLYEMLTGRLPFTGESSIAVAMQHVTEEPPPPRMYNPRIPLQLEALVLRALAKEPQQRPASALEFARMLQRYRDIGVQETVMRPAPVRAAPMRPAPARSVPRGVSQPMGLEPRTSLPPRPPVKRAPAADQQGAGFGGFLLGLLLLVGILGIVYVFAIGTFDGLNVFSPPTGSVSGQAQQTATNTPEANIATATPEVSPTPEVTPTPEVEMVQIPDLIGLTRQQAIDLLRRENLSPREDEGRFSDTVSRDRVLDQFPRAGQMITETETVTYVLSLGPQFVELNVPDVVGFARSSAVTRLQGSGLEVEVREEASTTVAQGLVTRQSPVAGARVLEGDTITIFISLGDVVTMPDLAGLPEEEARRIIDQLGLFWSFTDYQGCDRLPQGVCDRFAPGEVVSSEPRVGQVVPRGTGVTLGVRAP